MCLYTLDSALFVCVFSVCCVLCLLSVLCLPVFSALCLLSALFLFSAGRLLHETCHCEYTQPYL